MEGVSYQELKDIIQHNDLEQPTDTLLHQALRAIANPQPSLHLKIILDFITLLNNQRQCSISLQQIINSVDELQLMACQQNHIYQLGQQKRAYCIIGKTVTLAKKHAIDITQQQQMIRSQLITQLESAITKLFYSDGYPILKNQKQLSLSDILMQFYIPNDNYQPAYLGNDIYNTFLAVSPSIVLVVPHKNYKPPILDVIKATVLRVYCNKIQLLEKLYSRQPIYRHGRIEGVYFIEEGEVEVTSGRIVARGWVTKGVCKNSGYAWKFKPINFFKYIASNQNVWKQYLSDINNNGEFPFNLDNILSISEDNSFGFGKVQSSRFKSYNSTKLPKISLTSANVASKIYIEMEKLRHYDQRIDDIFIYKQDLLSKKLQGKSTSQVDKWIDSSQKYNRNSRLERMKRYLSSNNNKQLKRSQDSTESVLILSVLKRLESMASENQQKQDEYRIKFQSSKDKKLPMQLHEYNKHKKNRKPAKYFHH